MSSKLIDYFMYNQKQKVLNNALGIYKKIVNRDEEIHSDLIFCRRTLIRFLEMLDEETENLFWYTNLPEEGWRKEDERKIYFYLNYPNESIYAFKLINTTLADWKEIHSDCDSIGLLFDEYHYPSWFENEKNVEKGILDWLSVFVPRFKGKLHYIPQQGLITGDRGIFEHGKV